MWIEVMSKASGKNVLINTRYVQSVYPKSLDEDNGVVIDFGEYADNYFIVEGSYKKIRDLVSDGELTR